MGVETARSGTIPLKEGVTFADAVQLWLTRAGGAGDEPPAPGQDSWTDDYTVFRLYGAGPSTFHTATTSDYSFGHMAMRAGLTRKIPG